VKVKGAKQYQKIAVLGDAGVGKTSLCTRLTKENFHPGYELTVGVHIHSHLVELEGCSHRVLLYDVAGQPRFGDLLDVFIRGSMGICLVYDCSSILTFFSLEEVWVPFIRRNLPGVPIVLVASKIDQAEHIEVPDRQAERFMQEYSGEFNFVGFVKTSAKTGEHIEDVICQIIDVTIAQAPKDDPLLGPEKIPEPADNVGAHALSGMAPSHNRPSFLRRNLEDVQNS
jgi:small GTP-binding protein